MKSNGQINPGLSVLLCVYNGGVYLSLAIESIFAQTFPDFELVVVDDASDDETSAYLQGISDPRLRVFRNERQLGLTTSLNKGLEQCRAPLVARMDHDDICHPHRLAAQVQFLNAYPDIDVVGAWGWIIDEEGNPTGVWEPPTSMAEITAYFAMGRNIMIHPSVAFRREVILEAGGYGELALAQDFDLWCRLAVKKRQLANIPAQYLSYRWHQSQVSRDLSPEQRLAARGVVIGFLQHILPDNSRAEIAVLADCLAEETESQRAGFPESIVRLAAKLPELLGAYFRFSGEEITKIRELLSAPQKYGAWEKKEECVERKGGEFKGETQLSPETVRGLVSVIVDCRANSKGLTAAVGSVMSQVDAGVEVLLVDCPPADRARELAEFYGAKVRVLEEERAGSAYAWNSGLREARGEFIQLMEVESLLHPEKLARQIQFLQVHSEVDVVYSNACFFEYPIFGKFYPMEFVREAQDYSVALLAHSLFPVSAPLFRRSVVYKIGLFNAALSMFVGLEYFLRAALTGAGFAFRPEVLVYCRGRQIPLLADEQVAVQSLSAFCMRMEELLPSRALDPRHLQALLKTYIVDMLYRWQKIDYQPEARSLVERRALELVQLLEERGGLLGVDRSELSKYEEAMLMLYLAFTAKRAGWEKAERWLISGWDRIDELASAGTVSVKENVLELQILFAKIVTTAEKEWIRIFRDRLHGLAARFVPELLSDYRAILAQAELMQPVLAQIRRKGWQRVGFYGGGLHTKRLLALVDLGDLEIVGIIDDNQNQWGSKMYEHPVMGIQQMIELKPDAVIISSDQYEREMFERCRPLQNTGITVLRIYH